MCLNPVKCSFDVQVGKFFDVQVGKFLGFMLMNRGIKVNPGKFHVVIDIRSPTNVKEVQQLTSCEMFQ